MQQVSEALLEIGRRAGAGMGVKWLRPDQVQAIYLAMKAKDNGLSQDDKLQAQGQFTEYFVQNYPGPHTIIGNPHWHAPRIFRAALYAIQSAALVRSPETPITDDVRERVARAICTSCDDHWFGSSDFQKHNQRYFKLADAAITAIGRVSTAGDGE